MKIFIDTADINEIRKYAQMGIIDGVTTNPALIAKLEAGTSTIDVVNDITACVDGPLSVEVFNKDVKGMVKEAEYLANLHPNIVVKIPAIETGYETLKILTSMGIKTNFTIIYTANQALLGAKLGATYVSPFVGRLDINSTGGSDLIREIRTIYDHYGFKTQILAASMRTSVYVKEAALAGADCATVPPVALDDMINNELTKVSLDGFLAEYNASRSAS